MPGFLARAVCTALFCIGSCNSAEPATYDVLRSDIQRFAEDLSKRHGFDREALLSILREAIPQKRVMEAMQRPAERSLTWAEYRARFMTEERIVAGMKLWDTQRETLERIASERGVPAEYLVAITGVETFFGRTVGRYRVLDSLATLAFDHPTRSEYFTRELEQYLLMTREEAIDPRLPLGSYAGAMGAPQFMPSSLRAYAVDGNGDGHRNLWEQWPDIFASVANYLNAHGWERGSPVLAEATVAVLTDDPKTIQLDQKHTVASLRARGYSFATAQPDSAQAMLVPTEMDKGLGWRVGFKNFYVITRYNRSTLYAMAVHDLAEALKKRRSRAL
jgi:membrane-bound lytic murein transglycosylase B